jgi:hypothetical protein
MTDRLQATVDAHGGRSRWNQLKSEGEPFASRNYFCHRCTASSRELCPRWSADRKRSTWMYSRQTTEVLLSGILP